MQIPRNGETLATSSPETALRFSPRKGTTWTIIPIHSFAGKQIKNAIRLRWITPFPSSSPIRYPVFTRVWKVHSCSIIKVEERTRVPPTRRRGRPAVYISVDKIGACYRMVCSRARTGCMIGNRQNGINARALDMDLEMSSLARKNAKTRSAHATRLRRETRRGKSEVRVART